LIGQGHNLQNVKDIHLKRIKKILVDMYKMRFSKKENVVLYTEGVCTCIAFAIKGFYACQNESNSLQFFCGLYHWSGFAEGVSGKDQFDQAAAQLHRFFYNLRNELHLKSDLPLVITELHFIGGERRQETLQGTEQEVIALKKALTKIDFEEECISFSRGAICHSNFLTSGDQSLTISVSTSEISYVFDDEPSPIADESLQITEAPSKSI
jgi:hypothetical protein